MLLACSEYHALIYGIMHKQKTTLGNDNMVKKMIRVSTRVSNIIQQKLHCEEGEMALSIT